MSEQPQPKCSTQKIYCTNEYHKNAHTYGGEGQHTGNYSKKTSKKFPLDENWKSRRSALFSGRGAWKSLADDEGRVALRAAAVA
jgi:hypothetical protein